MRMNTPISFTGRYAAVPILFAFFCMGFGDVAGSLTSQIQNDFTLSYFTAGLLTFMGFIMFGVLSIPMGIIQARIGKKNVLLFGLGVALCGLILPIISHYSNFTSLLASILLLGAGATCLQVAGNPIMRDVSPEGKYSRNLSLGQFIKAIGSLSGSLIPLLAAKYWGLDWKILFPLYAGFIFLTILYIFLSPIRERIDEIEKRTVTFHSCMSLLTNKTILLLVLGIFFYVGAEVSIASKLPNYLKDVFYYDIKKLGLLGTLLFFIALTFGRFLGSIILNWISPKRFLIITLLVSITGNIMLLAANSTVAAFSAILIVGIGFANIFPLIFSIAIDYRPEKSNEISGLMVTAIIGGAIIPLFFGIVADLTSVTTGFIIPLCCMLYLLSIATINIKRL